MNENQEYSFLLEKILRNRNLDFSQYRPQVLLRRLEHRFRVTDCDDYIAYIMLLNRDPDEYDRLIETLTIKVSEFFRDSMVFELLGKVVIPEIIAQKDSADNKTIRGWSCGSAHGQEAYSIAMLLHEELGFRADNFNLNIIATDIDKNALEEAPWIYYDKKALKKLKAHVIFKYFTSFEDRYIVNDRIRKLIRFKYHNVTAGKPISKVDLVLCRNLLIYFEKELQEKALRNIHSSMNHGGFLILGMTETLPPSMKDYFEVIDLNARIYMKKNHN